jgi:hypothetical protein
VVEFIYGRTSKWVTCPPLNTTSERDLYKCAYTSHSSYSLGFFMCVPPEAKVGHWSPPATSVPARTHRGTCSLGRKASISFGSFVISLISPPSSLCSPRLREAILTPTSHPHRYRVVVSSHYPFATQHASVHTTSCAYLPLASYHQRLLRCLSRGRHGSRQGLFGCPPPWCGIRGRGSLVGERRTSRWWRRRRICLSDGNVRARSRCW